MISSFWQALRPKHWTKNLLVFAAPLFSFKLDQTIWITSLKSLICFCIVSSAIYLINDSLDADSDKAHPTKRFRPIAAGKISLLEAYSSSFILILIGLYLGYLVSNYLFLILTTYLIIQILYCIKLKEEPLLDLFCISSGFLLRSIAGGISSDLEISPWFLLSISLLALFLALEKRKAELRQTLKTQIMTRKVLARYSLPLLLRLESLVATSSFVTYSLWAAGPALQGASTSWMLITVPFVLLGIFRYQLISDPNEEKRRNGLNIEKTTESPEEILIKDKGILSIVISWLITTIVIGLITFANN